MTTPLTTITPYLPAANINTNFSTSIGISGGTAPYSFAIISGSMPPGLTMDSQGNITGIATQLGLYNVVIEISDATTPTPLTLIQTFQFTVLDIIDLSSLTVDQTQFVQQFQQVLATTGVWSSGITTQTSQTLIDFVSAIGTFVTGKINRIKEDAFPNTAQSDSAIRAITTMQGIRLSRCLPAQALVTMSSNTVQTIPPFTQFSGGGYSWFNNKALVFPVADTAYTFLLSEGTVFNTTVSGLGTDFQTWVSKDTNFTVSDQDVVVTINGVTQYKSFGGLWNHPQVLGSGTQENAYADCTLNNGSLMLQFGANGYGAIPQVNDLVGITYAVTQGDVINGAVITSSKVTVATVTGITGMFTSNPSGGASQKSTVAYKNFAAGTFGTFGSAVTKPQYQSIVNSYPGIIDAVTQAQREINPAALEWMNVIRVSALTNSAWTGDQVNTFLTSMQSQTMYSPHFVWQPPQSVPVTVDISIYCFNSVSSLTNVEAQVSTAIQKLFSPRAGILNTDFFLSDLTTTVMNAAPGQISYVEINSPTQDMIVTAPASPTIVPTVYAPGNPNYQTGGMLAPLLYSYGIAVNVPSPNANFVALLNAATNPYFPAATSVGQYWIVSFAGTLVDPVTLLPTTVNVGDQVLATGSGNTATNFTVVPQATNGAIDVGVPSNWVYPQVTIAGSEIFLDWSQSAVPNAIQYVLWGRNGGAIGIIDTFSSLVTTFLDKGNIVIPVTPLATVSAANVRYNMLASAPKIRASYSNRQSSATFPVRDTLS